ncbi:hypothetical protein H6758_03605 [Candidatus Nomurabacteria bacterium]|nr:hypothetical protein [Candidatus Nomurabacteria bacterium]
MLLSEKEKKTLSGLLQNGPSSVSDLSKIILINRTSLYPILEKLLSRGLVSKIQIEGHTVYKALSHQELSSWAKRKQDQTIQETKAFIEWTHTQPRRPQTLLSEIKYYEGLDGVMNLYDDTWRDNKEKTIYALTDYEQAYKVVGDEFLRNNYFKKRIEKGVKVKSLLPESAIGKKDISQASALLREMKFIDLFKDLGIEINVYDDKLAIFAFDPKNPSGILIKNNTIANAFKHIFAFLWKSSTPSKNKKSSSE